MPRWDLLFTFPNLVPPVPSPFDGRDIYLCSADDPRLGDLATNPGNTTGRAMLDRFASTFGTDYRPACLLIRQGAPERLRHREALSAFRNVCAISTTSRVWAMSLLHPWGASAQSGIKWSDNFFFGFHTPGHSGAIVTLNGAMAGLDNRINRFRGQPSAHIGVPTHYHPDVDAQLLTRLMVAWRRYYVQNKERRVFRRLFRSLEVAFHAGLFPGDGLTSINDVGTRLGLWVSAFEVLFHPSQQSVGKRVVQAQLQGAPFQKPAMRARRYTVWTKRNGVRTKHAAVLAEALYDDLYAARNDFMHGNSVTGRDVRYRRSSRHVPLMTVAPVLYNIALLSFLKGQIPDGPEAADALPGGVEGFRRYLKLTSDSSQIEDGLLAARHRLDEHGNPRP
jgi:hypothetical protein